MRLAVLVTTALASVHALTAPEPGPGTLTAASGPDWRYVRVQRPGLPEDVNTVLSEVTAADRDTAWAAGSRGAGPLLVRWNGLAWRDESLPLPGDTRLEGVSAISRKDAWVIGYGPDGGPRSARWDGVNWRAVPMPFTPGIPSIPRAVDARTATDAWIAGSTGTQATTWHWEGHSWGEVPIPDSASAGSRLTAVSSRTATDVWAVGGRGPRPLIMHGDGRAWTPWASPDLPGEAELTGVVTLAADDVWAVGSTRTAGPAPAPNPGAGAGDLPLAEHWDGQAWQIVPVPGVTGRFYTVIRDGRGGIWAGGESGEGTALLIHWDGHRWERSSAPVPDSPDRRQAIPSAIWSLAGPGPAHPGLPGRAGLGPGEKESIQRGALFWAAGSYQTGSVDEPTDHAVTWTTGPRPR